MKTVLLGMRNWWNGGNGLSSIDSFERVSLGLNRCAPAKQAAALPSLYRGCTIVVFGDDCRQAVGLPQMLLHPIERNGITWRQLPDLTSEWYGDPECYDLAASLLCELFMKGKDNG